MKQIKYSVELKRILYRIWIRHMHKDRNTQDIKVELLFSLYEVVKLTNNIER